MKESVIILPNDRPVSDPGRGDMVPGVIYLANEARFIEQHQNTNLTTFSVGWQPEQPIVDELEHLAPGLEVARRFNYQEFINAEAFLIDTDDERAIGASFKEVKYTGKETLGKTNNHGLMTIVDEDETETDGWEQRTVAMLLDRMYRNSLKRGIDLIAATATNVAKTWNNLANPDGDIREMLRQGADAIGLRPSRVFIGETAADARLTSYETQNTNGGSAGAARTMESLAAYLNVERVLVSSSRYQSSVTAKTQFVANKVFAYLARASASKSDPTNIKRFWSPCKGGYRRRVFLWEIGPKQFGVAVEQYEKTTVTSTLGVRSLTIT